MGFIHQLITGGGPPCKRVYQQGVLVNQSRILCAQPRLVTEEGVHSPESRQCFSDNFGRCLILKSISSFKRTHVQWSNKKHFQKRESLIYQSTRRFWRTKMGLETTKYEEKGTMFIICGIISTNDWTRYARTILPSKECSSKGNVNSKMGSITSHSRYSGAVYCST